MTTDAPAGIRSRRRREDAVLRPLDQIERPPGGGGVEATGAWAYYLNPDGATIGEALVLYPNGGIPDIDNPNLRARYGMNAEYYRARQKRRGLDYIGPVLNEEAMARLVRVLENNRAAEVEFLMAEIDDAKDVAKNSDLPAVRNQAKRRIQQLTKRKDMIESGFDPDALLAELNEIARAQQLAKVDPNILRVMRSMIGEVNASIAEKIAHFQTPKARDGKSPAKLTGGSSDMGTEFDR